MNLVHTPSPNFNERPHGAAIDLLVLHYTAMPAQESLDRLRDPKAEVSCHYLIEEDGRVHAMVAEDKRAWHAGVSCWRGERDVNGHSIGIELVNPGHDYGYRPFPEAQMAALIELAQGILARHPIPARNVLAHSDVAPDRKQDPGEMFDWGRLARAGIGLWVGQPRAEGPPPKLAEYRRQLHEFGYDLPVEGGLDLPFKTVLVAFQRHFYPSCLDAIPDSETGAILKALLERITPPDDQSSGVIGQ